MVSDTNNQQVNTFTGGMDLDTSNAYMSEDNYREAYNLRITTDANSNSGTIHNIEGVKFDISFALPTVDGKQWNIVWTGTIRDYGLIIAKTVTKGASLSDGRVAIFRFKHSEAQAGHAAIRIFCSNIGTVSLGENPSCVTRYEDDDNIKLYVADGVNSVRVWNVSPNRDKFNQGLIDDSSLSVYPSVVFDRPEFQGFGKGSLLAGTYQFGYQLFNKNGSETEVSPLTGLTYISGGPLSFSSSTQCVGELKGKSTNKSVRLQINVPDKLNYTRLKIISIFWEDRNELPLIQVLQDSGIPESGIVYYEAFNNNGINQLSLEEFNMITNVHFAPTILESKNNYLFASNITYLDNSTDYEYDARAYRFYAASTAIKTANVTILASSNGNNINISQEALGIIQFNIDASHDVINSYNDTGLAQQLFYDQPYDKLSEAAKADTTRYRFNSFVDNNINIVGGIGKNITYRFLVGDLEESSTISNLSLPKDDDSVTSISSLCEGMWAANVTTTGELVNSRFIPLSFATSGTKNYSNPQISYNFKSLQRDEIYRYGIIMYDKYGMVTPVKWIGDIRTPSMSDPGFETFQNDRTVSFTASGKDAVSCELAVRPLGIEFEVRNLPKDIVAYEIVRCERTEADRSILAQGIISRLGQAKKNVGSDYLNNVFPPAIMHCSRTYRQFWTNIYDRDIRLFDNNYFMFAAPEVSYSPKNFQNYINDSTLRLEIKKAVLSCLAEGTNSSNKIANTGNVVEGGGTVITFSNSSGMEDIYWKVMLDTARNVFKPYIQANYYDEANFVTPEGRTTSKVGSSHEIINIILPKDLTWSDYGNRINYAEAIDGFNYINWIEECYGIETTQSLAHNPVGPNGRCLVMNASLTKDMFGIENVAGSIRGTINSNIKYGDRRLLGFKAMLSTTFLCNLKRNVVPYGGNSYSSRQYSKYITNGAYKVKASTNKINVFDGDTFIGVFDYIKTHYGIIPPDQTQFGKPGPAPTIYYIPVESSINLALTNSEEYHRNKKPQTQLEPANVNGLYVQSEPAYVYNPVYSVQATAKEYSSASQYAEYGKHMDTRTYHSEPKINDEIIDAWTKFKPLNYIDVDTRHGSINNLRTFGNELIFWQDTALGKFSVLERTMVTDESNAPLLLGTGGVLNRFDYVATANGIRKEHHDCDAQSDQVLYWFDQDKQEICAYSGNVVTPISKKERVQSYVKRLVVENTKLKNRPFLEYDKLYNELLCSLSTEDTLVYNESIGKFTSFFTLVPDYTLMFNRNMFMVKSNSLYQFNGNTVNTDFDSNPLPIEFKYVVNRPYNYVKVFDNVEFTGLLNKDNILGITCSTETMTGDVITPTDITDREYNFRFAVPRVKTSVDFPNRLRGRYLECLFKYDLVAQADVYLVSHEDEYLNTYDDKYMVSNRGTISNQVSRQLKYYTITGENAETFELPYVRTTFRVSKS